MKHIVAAAFAVCLTFSPAFAQEAEEDGFNLMEEGAKLFMRGVLSELEPAMEELEGLADEVGPALEMMMAEMGPALMGIVEQIDDLSYYEMPEVLENGDIILRRRPSAPEYVPEPMPEEIEL